MERAETNAKEAESADVYGHLALDMMAKLSETQQELSFLRDRLRYREELEVIARNRTHRAIGELTTAILAIREREEMLKAGEIEFAPYRVKTQEEIFGIEDLPLASRQEVNV